MAVDFQTILFDKSDGIGRVTLNRPALKNPFELEVRQEFLSLLTELRDDESLKVLILTGAGDAFSSGGNVRSMEGPEFTPVGGRRRLKRAHRVIRAMLDFEKPIIAAVNGVAAGAGVSVALACDLVLASDKARFILSFSRLGLVPDLGAFYLLPLRVGVMRAKELMWTADPVGAREAERWGLVNRVVPHERLEEEAFSLARRLAQGPLQAYAMIKAALNQWPASLESLLEMESTMQAVVFASEDFEEGRRAFLEKRSAQFKGR